MHFNPERMRQQIEKSNGQQDASSNMNQYFGHDSYVNKHFKVESPHILTTENKHVGTSKVEKSNDYFQFIGSLPLNNVYGLAVILSVCIVGVIMSVFRLNFGLFIGVLFVTAIIVFTAIKWKVPSFDANLNYYAGNATLTLKALLKQFPVINSAWDKMSILMAISAGSLIAYYLLLQWILPSFIANVLFGVAFFLLGLTAVAQFAERNTKHIANALKSIYLAVCISLVLSLLIYNAFSYFNALFGLACYLTAITISNWDIKTTRKKSDNKAEQSSSNGERVEAQSASKAVGATLDRTDNLI